MSITETHIETYERDGTVLIPHVFADWTKPLEHAALTVIKGQRSGAIKEEDSVSGHQSALRVVENFGGGAVALNIVPHHANFERWLIESPAAKMVSQIMRSKQVRFWIDATFIKEEGAASEGTPWHNDTCTWPFWGNQMAILWIALTDVDKDNGPLTTVRGSHVGDGRYYSTFFPENESPPPGYKPWQDLLDQAERPEAEIQTWTMQRGDCLFMHPTTIHGSKPRASMRAPPRLAFSTRWLGDDVVWKPDPLTARMTAHVSNHPDMTYDTPPPDSVIPTRWPLNQ